MAIKIWVGKRESDILTYQYFDVSITFWGSNTNNNHSFCSSNRVKANYNKKFTEFVKDLLIKYISLDKNTEIHFYNNELAIQVKNKAINVGKRLMEINYRGICGLDFIFIQNNILLIEINPRYQGSSYLLNAVLNVYNLPSLFELNSICFSANYINNDITSQIDKMSVSFESYTSIYKLGGCNDIKNLPKNVLLFLDGLSNANKFEDGVYLYRYLKSEPK